MIPKGSRLALAAGGLLLSGCGDGVDLPVPAQIERVEGGDLQVATAGNRLAIPFQVLVTAEDGSGVPRAEVIWGVREGEDATLSDTLSVTDGNGVGQAYLTLGPAAGDYVVQASLSRKPDAAATFTAHAVAAPQLTGVNPATFTAGDEVAIAGFNITDSTIIVIGGRQAETLDVSALGRGLSAIVPSCLVPGQVSIVARVGLAESAAINGTFVAATAPLDLDPGDYMSLDPAVLEGCATFDSATTDREYLFAPQSVTDTPGLTLAFEFRGNQVTAPTPLPSRRSPGERPLALKFEDFLRAQEAQLAKIPREPLREQPLLAPIELDIQVGDRRSFRVCADISCGGIEDFSAVTGVVKYVGERAVIYQDVAGPGELDQADIDELGALFDLDLYEVDTRAFGAESDIDRNGRILILMTPVVNSLTPKSQCPTSFITGFFYPLDIDPNAEGDRRSNRAEVFYSMVPDPQGTVTCSHSADRVKRLVPVTFVHEFQHMINFYQHVIVRAGNSERTWLNEALSHMAEELAALHFEALGNSDRFTAFALGDLFNAYQYLSATEDHFPLYSAGTGTIEERGATWLLLRWLADQKGEGVLRQLTETALVGAENLSAAAGEPLATLLPDWYLANYISSYPDLTSIPERLSYSTWNFRATYADLHTQDDSEFPKEFPIDPPVFDGGDFSVTGMLGSGSGAYYRVIQSAGQPGFAVELVDAVGNPLSGPAQPVLNVFRIK